MYSYGIIYNTKMYIYKRKIHKCKIITKKVKIWVELRINIKVASF